MANRQRTLDQQVYCIKDLERLGSEKLEKTYRGKWYTSKGQIKQNTDLLRRVL
jgi:hypothetical protein